MNVIMRPIITVHVLSKAVGESVREAAEKELDVAVTLVRVKGISNIVLHRFHGLFNHRHRPGQEVEAGTRFAVQCFEQTRMGWNWLLDDTFAFGSG